MHRVIPVALVVLGACCSTADAAQEFACTGPDALTGKAIGPTTLSISGFACEGAPAPYNALGDRASAHAAAPFVVVDFKAPAPPIKTGDMVTLKGHFYVVADPDHHIDYVVVTDAELAQ